MAIRPGAGKFRRAPCASGGDRRMVATSKAGRAGACAFGIAEYANNTVTARIGSSGERIGTSSEQYNVLPEGPGKVPTNTRIVMGRTARSMAACTTGSGPTTYTGRAGRRSLWIRAAV